MMSRQRALLAIVIAAIAFPSLAATFWVSPSGSDNNAGTKDAPFATLEHAVGATGASGDCEIVVYVADGTYRLDRPLVFKPNGPVVEIRAAAGAKPVISGAVKIGGWTQVDKTRNIWRADAGKYVSRQLYVNGKRAVRARTDLPNGNIPAGFLPSRTTTTTTSRGSGKCRSRSSMRRGCSGSRPHRAAQSVPGYAHFVPRRCPFIPLRSGQGLPLSYLLTNVRPTFFTDGPSR
jgi:hypothetical protein